ncbi:hypothetical protein BDF20DRAFT_878559 [Mycotypha africana]|uniref:uncharacterized protein n=1 Tax=Mycotypha africana TaxID=64632 RepID=UPI002301508F|nr:uncharacterized protein BDF20DRAFT_878559 [Mycotypha africana]KAI8975417.1 hypothetical protein BDF20DRAFT_878559 [Mycotypha africana]
MDEISIANEEVKVPTKSKSTVGRISRLFQKKNKKPLTTSASTLSLSPSTVELPLSKQSTYQSFATGSQISFQQQYTDQDGNSYLEPRQSVATDNNNINSTDSNISLDAVSIHSALNLTRNTSITSRLSSAVAARPTPPIDIKQKIQQQRQLLRDLEIQKRHYTHEAEKLKERLEKAQEKLKQRTHDMDILKNNYRMHLRSVRCSDDEPASIGQKLLILRQRIHDLASEILPYADPSLATEKLSTLWINLGPFIERLGKPLSPQRIQMLTEKFIMDVLVQNLNIHTFPGFSCNSQFAELQTWFDQYDPSSFFSTRLRQELSMVVVQQRDTAEDIHRVWKNCVERNWHHLYKGLQKVYPCFLTPPTRASTDSNSTIITAQSNEGRRASTTMTADEYSRKLYDLVKYTMSLGSAIKGQEVPITAMDVREGEQLFDPNFMEDEDKRIDGVIAFCVSPPFVMKLDNNRYEPLLKGRVLCFPRASTTSSNIPVSAPEKPLPAIIISKDKQ